MLPFWFCRRSIRRYAEFHTLAGREHVMRLHTVLVMLSQLLLLCGSGMAGDGPWFASGIKVGEATQTSAIVWVRLTQQPEAAFDRLPILTEGLPSNERSSLRMPTDVVPGSPGRVRVRFKPVSGESDERSTPWVSVSDDTDFCHQFTLTDLHPGQRYGVVVESTDPSGQPGATMSGGFTTAPEPSDGVPVRFIVTTCQAVRSIDSGADGHVAYRQMLTCQPDFFVHTGDILYYDKVPLSRNLAEARAKWNLMFAYRYNRDFHRQVTSYFMKDDHDTLKNDCWPGQKYGDLTFEQGLAVFREQVCMGPSTFRTVRWGRDVQVWMTENRDFRSPNNMPDGPEKTILGKRQKAWLKKSMSESDATFRFLISPGPLVGPDKRGKRDNHANAAFAHEGSELRKFVASLGNAWVICGDRHWQYCSEDPETHLVELGCGPINDQHSFGGNPGYEPKYHRYFGARGGFLVVTVQGKTATAEWLSANEPVTESGRPRVLHVEHLAGAQ